MRKKGCATGICKKFNLPTITVIEDGRIFIRDSSIFSLRNLEPAIEAKAETTAV